MVTRAGKGRELTLNEFQFGMMKEFQKLMVVQTFAFNTNEL